MPDDFISIKCASCGAQLQVFDDMDRFVCTYCKTEMLVQRRGGTVSLKGVTDALGKVQAGTDRTADELSLARLESELVQLKKEQINEIQKLDSKALWPPLLIMFGGGFAGVLLADAGGNPQVIPFLGGTGIVVGFLVFLRGRRDRSTFVAAQAAQVKESERRISEIRARLS